MKQTSVVLMQATADQRSDGAPRQGEARLQAAGRRIISLDEQERELFDILRGCVRDRGLSTVVRVAGGWVRDKLLGRANHDIDIAIDNMTGVTFAEHLNAHLEASGRPTHRVGVVQANPEQSKHLETAMVKVLGIPLDLVNLRAEEYADASSRIPTMRFGTAREDAERRDFTVNSLFFNVNESTIEDHTGYGVEDLEAGLIRTPLNPVVTMQDDPLRVLRAVRFASRYAFRLVPQLSETIIRRDIRELLATKVSRERVGTELDGMLRSDRPLGALRMLRQLRLSGVVFALPEVMFRTQAIAEQAAPERGNKSKKGKQKPVASPEEQAAAALARLHWGDYIQVADRTGASHEEVLDSGALVLEALAVILNPLVTVGSPAAPASTAGAGEGATAEAVPLSISPADPLPPTPSGLPGGQTQTLPDPVGLVTRTADAQAVVGASGSAAPEGVSDWLWSALPQLGTEPMRILLLAAQLWPLRSSWCFGADGRDKHKPQPAAQFVVKTAIKRRALDATQVGQLHEAAQMLVGMALLMWPDRPLAEAEPTPDGYPTDAPSPRLQLARVLMAVGDLWLPALLLAQAALTARHPLAGPIEGGLVRPGGAWHDLHLQVRRSGDGGGASAPLVVAGSEEAPAAAGAGSAETSAPLPALEPCAAHSALARGIAELHRLVTDEWKLVGCWDVKPLYSGRELMQAPFNAPRGPAVGRLVTALQEWQVLHPGAEKADAEAWLARAIQAERDQVGDGGTRSKRNGGKK